MSPGEVVHNPNSASEESSKEYLADLASHVEQFYTVCEHLSDSEYEEWLEVCRVDIDVIGRNVVGNLFALCDNMTTLADIEMSMGFDLPLRPDIYTEFANMFEVHSELEGEAEVSKKVFEIMRVAALDLAKERIAKHGHMKRVEIRALQEGYGKVGSNIDTMISLLRVRNSVVDVVGVVKEHLGLPEVDNKRMKEMLEKHLEIAKAERREDIKHGRREPRARQPDPQFIEAVEQALIVVHDASVERQRKRRQGTEETK